MVISMLRSHDPVLSNSIGCRIRKQICLQINFLSLCDAAFLPIGVSIKFMTTVLLTCNATGKKKNNIKVYTAGYSVRSNLLFHSEHGNERKSLSLFPQ